MAEVGCSEGCSAFAEVGCSEPLAKRDALGAVKSANKAAERVILEKIFMLSSSDGIFDIAKGQARGATAHVTKIPSESVLRQLIHNHTNMQAVA